MKTKDEITKSTERFTKEIEKNGIKLFEKYYDYVDPESDLGIFRRLQELNAQKGTKSCAIKK